MGDGRVGVERRGHFVAARRQIVALVDQPVGAPEILHRLRGPQPIGAVGQHQQLAVARHERAEHRLDRERAAALDRHAIELALLVPDQRQQARRSSAVIARKSPSQDPQSRSIAGFTA